MTERVDDAHAGAAIAARVEYYEPPRRQGVSGSGSLCERSYRCPVCVLVKLNKLL